MLLARMPAPLRVALNGSHWEIMKKYLPNRDDAAQQVVPADAAASRRPPRAFGPRRR